MHLHVVGQVDHFFLVPSFEFLVLLAKHPVDRLAVLAWVGVEPEEAFVPEHVKDPAPEATISASGAAEVELFDKRIAAPGCPPFDYSVEAPVLPPAVPPELKPAVERLQLSEKLW